MPHSAAQVVDQRETLRLVMAQLEAIEAEHSQVKALRPTDPDPEAAEGGPVVFIRLANIDHAPDIASPATDSITITVHATCTAAQLALDYGTLAWAASRIRAQLDNARGMEAASAPTQRVTPRWGSSRMTVLEPQEGRYVRAVEVVFTGKATRLDGDTLGDPFAA